MQYHSRDDLTPPQPDTTAASAAPQPERIPLDRRDDRRAFLQLLDTFGTWVYTNRVRDVLGKEMLDLLQEQERQIRSRLDDDFTLVVLGSFKRGKSTLVNALLGTTVVTMDALPETVTINEIGYGDHLRVEACLTNGARVRLEQDDLEAERLVPALKLWADDNTDGELLPVIGVDLIDHIPKPLHDRLRQLLLQGDALASRENLDTLFVDPRLSPWRYGMPEANNKLQRLKHLLRYLHNQYNKDRENALVLLLQVLADDYHSETLAHHQLLELADELDMALRGILRAQRQQAAAARSGFLESDGDRSQLNARFSDIEGMLDHVSHLNIEVPAPWLQGVRLVDTPGLGDVVQRFDSLVAGYLPHADALIYVMSAQYPLSESEQTFLDLSVVPRDFSKLMFVANMMDRYDEHDRVRVLENVTRQIDARFPQAQLFGVSAFYELCRRQNEPRDHPERAAALDQAFDRFRTTLSQALLLKRDVIQRERSLVETERMLADLAHAAGRVQQASRLDGRQLQTLQQMVGSEHSPLRQQVVEHRRHAAERWQTLATEACGWLDEFLDRMAAETIPSLAYVSYGDVRRHFHFFFGKVLLDALRSSLRRQLPQMLLILEETRREIAAELQEVEALVESYTGEALLDEDGAETLWHDLDLFEQGVEEAQGAVALLVDDLLLRVRQLGDGGHSLTESARSRRYRQALEEALPGFRERVRSEIQELYGKLLRQMDDRLQQEFRQRRAPLRSVVEQVLAAQEDEQSARREQQQTLQQLQAHIADIQQQVADLRASRRQALPEA